MQLHIIGLGVSETALLDSAALQALELKDADSLMSLGREGGSAAVVITATCNALLRCNQGEWY